MKESHLRSIAKGLTWRCLATFTTATIAYFVTGSMKPALAIGAVEFFLKFFIYYAHERAWTMVPLGTFQRLKQKLKLSKEKRETSESSVPSARRQAQGLESIETAVK